MNIMRWGFVRGKRQLMPMNGSEANDIGEFRISGLPPGKYFLAVRPQNYFGREVQEATNKPAEGFVPTFYPGVTDSNSATAIDVAPGQEHTGLTVRLQKARVYRITGKVAGLTGDLTRTQVTLSPRDRTGAWFGGGGGRIKPDGSFEMRGVVPGSYYVMAMRYDRMPITLGRASVDVTNNDVEGVMLSGGAAIPQLRGVVKVAGDTPIDLKSVQVSLISTEMLPIGTRPVPLDEKGEFLLEQVAREKFTVNLFPVPEGTYLKAIHAGGHDVTKTGIDLTSAESAPPIEVILSTKPATVEGTVTRAKPEDPPGSVMLLPDPWRPEDPASSMQMFRLNTPIDQTGRFTIKGLAPGKYRLYAFEEFNMQEMMDPELFKALESKAEAFELGEGERKTANPRQIRASEVAERR